MTTQSPSPKLVHLHILRWYKKEGRSLPWRKRLDPYSILISEIMLQQTQVNRVMIKFPNFMALFPTVQHLATASQKDVVLAWQGMGYNNRAVRLHRLAKLVVEHHGGKIPREIDELRSLPGVGRYTAHAMIAFAYRKKAPLVDINIRRVLSRILWRMPEESSLRPENDIWEAARKLLPTDRVYDWNQALMDLGALVCSARAPKCVACPVSRECRSIGRMKHATRKRIHAEPSRRGVPNRVYRGKIVETLRMRPSGVPLSRLGHLIAPDFKNPDLPWLKALVNVLAQDGLVRISRRGQSSRYVSLA